MTTITAFSNAVADLTITGVKTKSRKKPASKQSAAMPYQYVEYPLSGSEPIATCSDVGKTRTVNLIVLLEPVNQDRPEANHVLMLTMADNMETALDTLHASLGMIINYNIVGGEEVLGGITYFALTATVTGED